MSGSESRRGDILVVDDSPTSRIWARAVLELAEYWVREAASAREALDIIAEQPPDLVLLDVILPDFDGFEVTDRLRRDETLGTIPIILVTSLGDIESKVRGLRKGANDFLTKPIEEAELLARIGLHLRLKRNREELGAEKARIELLYRISRELSAELDLDMLLSRILDLTLESLDASGGSIVLLGEWGEGLHCISSRQGRDPAIAKGLWDQVLREGLAQWVIQHRQGTLVRDTRKDLRWIVIEGVHAAMRSALSAPLVYAGWISGVLTLTHEEPDHFTSADLDLLNSIASQGAVVTEKARLYHKEQLRARQLRLINEVGRQATSILDPTQLLKEVSHLIRQAFDYYYVEIALCQGEGLLFQGWGCGRSRDLNMPPARLALDGQGIVPWVARHGKPLLVPDAHQDSRYIPVANLPDTVAELAVPLKVGNEIIGVLDVQSDRYRQIRQEEIPILETLASQVAVALKNARLFQERESRIAELTILNEIGRALSSILVLGELLEAVYHHVSRIFDTSNFYIATYEEGVGEWALAFHIEGGERQPLSRYGINVGLTGYVIRSGDPLLLRSVEENAIFLTEKEIGLIGEAAKSWMGVPLLATNRTIGMMALQSYQQEHAYDEQDMTLFSMIANLVSSAIENARLYTETEQERGKLSAVLAGTDDAVVVTDDAGRMLLLNPAAERAFGVQLKEVIGRPLTDVAPISSLANLLGGGSSVYQTVEISLANAHTFYATVSPVTGVGYVAVLQDITPLKELEWMRLQAERVERDRLHRTLKCYVGPDLVDQVLAEEGALLERRERVEAIVLFADIRGFTPAAATLSPEVAVEVLNEFFTAMTQIIYRNEGTVIDFIGDELMASFGAPLPRSDAALRASEAAIAMQKEFNKLQSDWSNQWGIDVGLGVGIDRGQAVMGNVGTTERVSFTLIGNVVNRAHRLVEQANSGEILISEQALEAIPRAQRPCGALEKVPEVLLGGPQQAYYLRS